MATLALALALNAAASDAAPVARPTVNAVPPVVSTAWLADQLAVSPASIVLVDARPGLRPYLTGHLPGAQPLCVDNLRSTSGGVPAMLLPWEAIHLQIRRLGLARATRVVVYSDQSDLDAAYVASVLRLAGLAHVAILDGGFERWTDEKRPVTKARQRVAATTDAFTPDARAVASLDDVRKALEAGETLLLDTRPEAQHAAGHIPGAKSRYWEKDVVPDVQPNAGAYRTDTEMRAELEALGAKKDVPVIVYCNSGHQAMELFYTLKYRLGHPQVRLYDGSWLEWTMTSETPKETSPAPTAPPAERAPAR